MESNRGRANTWWLGDVKTSSGRLKFPALNIEPIKFVSKNQNSIPTGFASRDDFFAAAIAVDYMVTLAQLLEAEGFRCRNMGVSVEIERDKFDAISEVRIHVNANLPGLDSQKLITISEQAKKSSRYINALSGILFKINIESVEFKYNKNILNSRELISNIFSKTWLKKIWKKKKILLTFVILFGLIQSGQIRSGSDVVDSFISTGNSIKYAVFKENPALSLQDEISHVKKVCKNQKSYSLKNISQLKPETCTYFEIIAWNVRKSNLSELVLFRNCKNNSSLDNKSLLSKEALCARDFL